MILANATLLDGSFMPRRWDLEIRDGQILSMGPNLTGDDRLDLSGAWILPGFIDTHIHGAYGTRVTDPDPDLSQITRFEATQGVTGIALTTGSSAFDDLLRQFAFIAQAAPRCEGAQIWGIHAEGPYLNTEKKGAMNPKNLIRPDPEGLDRLIAAAGGLLKLITIAPEIPGGPELIRYAAQKGLTVSLGHTNATCEQATAGILSGATQATHTFNAMRSLHHREPGILGAILTDDRITCEMICDHVHLHPTILQMIFRLKGPEKINIISDSGHAAGLNISEFTVDGITRYVKDGVARLADGTIAGSTRTVLDGVRNLLQSGIPMGQVSRMASLNPARTLKIDRITGSIEPGKQADLVVLDENYNVMYTFVNGKPVYKATKEETT